MKFSELINEILCLLIEFWTMFGQKKRVGKIWHMNLKN